MTVHVSQLVESVSANCVGLKPSANSFRPQPPSSSSTTASLSLGLTTTAAYWRVYRRVSYPVSTGIFPHSLPEWAFRARYGLWQICLCPKVARIAEHKFGNRYVKVRANILFP